MRVVGHVDGLVGQGLRGWVCCPDSLEERLWVELLVDDCVLGVAHAEQYHPDATVHGDGCYGFWLPLLAAVQESGGTAQVRVANTQNWIEPKVELASAVSSVVVLGEVGNDMGLTLSGWAKDPVESRRKVRISAWHKGKCVVVCTAGGRRFRPDGSDGHGFSLTLPLELADGCDHQVEIFVDRPNGTKLPLPGSPLLVCALPEGIAQWFNQQKKIENPQRKLTETFLRHYESWLPKGVKLDEYECWKACFPVPAVPAAKQDSVGIVDGREITTARLIETAHKYTYIFWHDGDKLHPQAVPHLVRAIKNTDADLVYADSETRNADGQLMPLCKPAWDPWHFLGQDYLGPLLVRSSLVHEADCRSKDAGSTLRTRLILATSQKKICHLPFFLSETTEQSPAVEALALRRETLECWLQQRVPGAQLEPLPDAPHLNRVRLPLPRNPLVSLIIPTRDRADLLRACLESLRKSTYPHVEILIVDNGSSEPEAVLLLDEAAQNGARVLSCPGAFNYAAINNFAAQQANGEILCFLNNDTCVLASDWLEEMLGVLLNGTLFGNAVGCAGAKLLWPNELVQHGGVVTGTHALAAHVGNQWNAHDAGYMNRNLVLQQWSAVTAACLMTPKELFLESGGFDAVRFPVTFNDVDYCLRVRGMGMKVVWTPHAQLMHHESASRGRDASLPQKARSAMEMHHFRTQWGRYNDPFYNPNLSLSTVLEPFGGLALPPRSRSER